MVYDTQSTKNIIQKEEINQSFIEELKEVRSLSSNSVSDCSDRVFTFDYTLKKNYAKVHMVGKKIKIFKGYQQIYSNFDKYLEDDKSMFSDEFNENTDSAPTKLNYINYLLD